MTHIIELKFEKKSVKKFGSLKNCYIFALLNQLKSLNYEKN